ncbi:hypothetical protein BJX68DRAFT_256926 [Aspergillus pseudodeflectus]|uniref:NAD(P)-binding protein n=1 Tax=Aspergillus pseudodeflectus TaxID=176178 RepID=A0ABR4JYU0_9EURO
MDQFPGVAVVTGAARGIGAAIVTGFAESGCHRIAITDILETELGELRQSLLTRFNGNPNDDPKGLTILAVPGDITSEPFIESFFTTTKTAFSRIDYLVNVAGVGKPYRRSIEVDVQEFDFINNVNYRAAWLCSRAALKIMTVQEPLPSPSPSAGTNESWTRPPQRGSIVNIASQLGVVSRPGASAYCASKAAVIGMTRADAIDYSKDAIRVNAVCPGIVETEMTTLDGVVREGLRESVNIAPMGRMGNVREIADCVLFLSSYRASFVQGHAMVVDGGYVIN